MSGCVCWPEVFASCPPDPALTLDAVEWGFCRYCTRLVPLTDYGTLDRHETYRGSTAARPEVRRCAGWGQEPTAQPIQRAADLIAALLRARSNGP